MPTKWIARRYGRDDESNIVELFDAVFGRGKWNNVKYWTWKYKENPAGFYPGNLQIADDGEKIVGHYGIIPVEIKIGDKIQNELTKAIKEFLKAVVYYPDEPTFWANLGGVYGSIGSFNKSIEILRKGLEFSPESVQLNKNLAVSYMSIGEYEKAVTVLDMIPAHKIKGNKEIERSNRSRKIISAR